mmetsp:Transcript_65261/g.103413  ORF Transcript_65261/g.103413 Transcript_65261/m.103413 type:complete len:477 (-) Transcript_65261:128-1558(-)
MLCFTVALAVAVSITGDCARIKRDLALANEVAPQLQTCAGIRVEKCRDCVGDFVCETCYKADTSDPFETGIVCTKSITSSTCMGSDFTFVPTVKCKIATMPVRPDEPPSVGFFDFRCPAMDTLVAAQELVSVPDNSFNLCLPSDPLPNEGVLTIEPVVKTVPFVITTAVEWLLYAGGYTAARNGTAKIGNKGTFVQDNLVDRMRYLPSSTHKWIAYTERSHTSRPKKLIVYCHGNFEGAHGLHFGKLDPLMHAMNGKLVAFEYPGYGGVHGTQGQSTITSVTYVTMAGLNYARQVWGWDPKDIILVGRSIGTGAAAEAAAMYEKMGVGLGGLILLSPYYSIHKLVASFTGGISLAASWAMNSHYFQTGLNIRGMTQTPVLIAHGARDEVIEVSQANDIYDEMCEECKSSGRMDYIKFAKKGHNDLSMIDVLDNGGNKWIAANPSLKLGFGPSEPFSNDRCIQDAKAMCRSRDGLEH